MLCRLGGQVWRASGAKILPFRPVTNTASQDSSSGHPNGAAEGHLVLRPSETNRRNESRYHACGCPGVVGLAVAAGALGAAHEAVNLVHSYRSLTDLDEDVSSHSLGAPSRLASSLCTFHCLHTHVLAHPTLLSGHSHHARLPSNESNAANDEDDTTGVQEKPPTTTRTKKTVRFDTGCSTASSTASTQTDASANDSGPSSLKSVIDHGSSELSRCGAALDNSVALDCLRQGLKDEALRYFRRSAERGDPNAMFNVAQCLYKGYGTGRSLSNAIEWWNKASELGHKSAKYQLDVCRMKDGAASGSGEIFSPPGALSTTSQGAFYAGVAQLYTGDVDGGMQLVKKAAEMKNKHAVAFLRQIASQQSIEDVPPEAVEDATQWLRGRNIAVTPPEVKAAPSSATEEKSRFWSAAGSESSASSSESGHDDGDLRTPHSGGGTRSLSGSEDSICFTDNQASSFVEGATLAAACQEQPKLIGAASTTVDHKCNVQMRKSATVHDFRPLLEAPL